MKLLEFAVTGYKNLSREVRLTDLGRVNVIHGDNNVGKSNLLEAMQLFFALLGHHAEQKSLVGPGKESQVDSQRLLELTEHNIGEIFDLRGPSAAVIRLDAKIFVPVADFVQLGLSNPGLITHPLSITLELRRDPGRSGFRVAVIRFQLGGNPLVEGLTQRIALYVARNPLVNDPGGRPAFALIEENRHIRGRPEPSLPLPAIISPTILLNLWDASVSSDPLQIGRWKLLQDLVKRYLPPFQTGELIVAFDRNRNTAFMSHEQPGNIRLRHHLLGTGVQQVLGLLGLLLTTDARFIAVEEPECNLRYTLQLRLREALDALTRDERGPQQLFLTSHSPAFETEEFFYAMRLDDQGVPTVERRPAKEARKFVAIDAEPPPVGAHGEVSWVSSEGLLLVPPRLRPRLDVQSGGEVAFLTNQQTGRVELLSEREYLDLLGPGEDDPEAAS